MKNVKWLLPLLLLVCTPARGAVNTVNHCGGHNVNITAGNAAICHMSNAGGSGHKIIISGMFVVATTYTITATETVTCPGGAATSKNFSGFVHSLYICYIDSAAASADYVITATVNTGAGSNEGFVEAWDVTGLAAGTDAVAATNSTYTLSITTASSGAWIYSNFSDHATTIGPSGSNAQLNQMWGSANTPPQYLTLSTQQTGGAPGATNTVFTSTGSDGLDIRLLAAISFVPSGGTSTPSVYISQRCQRLSGGGAGTGDCELKNVVTGDTVVMAAANQSTVNPGCSSSTPVGLTIPSGAGVQHTYGGNGYGLVLCYSIAASNIATYHLTATNNSGSEPNIWVQGFVIKGLASLDSSSGASAAAITVNYTTAAVNEYTIFASFDNNSAAMIPGNSFIGTDGLWQGLDASAVQQIGMVATKTTTASGSNTASYTLGGSSRPLITTISFAPSPSNVPRKKGLIFP